MVHVQVSSGLIISVEYIFIAVEQKTHVCRSTVVLWMEEVPVYHLAADPPTTRVLVALMVRV